MLPLVIQLGSLVVGRVVANQITNLIKKDQEGKYEYKYHFIKIKYIQLSYNENIKKKIYLKEVRNGYFKRFYSTNFSSNYKQYLNLKGVIL